MCERKRKVINGVPEVIPKGKEGEGRGEMIYCLIEISFTAELNEGGRQVV